MFSLGLDPHIVKDISRAAESSAADSADPFAAEGSLHELAMKLSAFHRTLTIPGVHGLATQGGDSRIRRINNS